MNDLHPLTQAIIAGRRKEIPDLVNQCLAAGEKAGNETVCGIRVV